MILSTETRNSRKATPKTIPAQDGNLFLRRPLALVGRASVPALILMTIGSITPTKAGTEARPTKTDKDLCDKIKI
jgi:hypothetical protein